MPAPGVRALLVALVVAAAAVSSLVAAEPVLGHESDCHVQQTCPSDDHTYNWSDGTRQWDCGLAPESGLDAGATEIVYEGQRYACYPLTEEPPATSPPPTTETVEPPAIVNPVAEPPPARKRERPVQRTRTPHTQAPTPQMRFPAIGGAALPAGRYVFPIDGPASFSDDFGAARATTTWHHGNDIFAPLGTPVIAVTAGVLLKVGWQPIGGNRLWLRDRRGNYFYYAHLAGFAPGVADGVRVHTGQLLGYVGNTGDAVGTPYHLHFEIHPASLFDLGYDGVVNPFPYLERWPRLEDVLEGIARIEGTPAAPAPAAILLTASDISSASGLEPETLVQTMQEPVTPDQLRGPVVPPAAVPPTREEAPAYGERAAALADFLDRGASSPIRSAGPTIWDALAGCESGGDWHANTGNGFFGGLQFHPGTWLSHGGATFARSAHLATREQQILIARRVLASQGWVAWPVCSIQIGLR
jgi:hypothetical protein